MSYLAENWYWMIAAAGSGSALLWLQMQDAMGSGGLSPQEAVMVINREKATVIDVCSPDEFANGHVKGARNIPLDQIKPDMKGLPGNKSTPVLLMCASGIRAGKAAQQLKAMGYERAQVINGGMKAWRQANLPFDKTDKAEKA
jgi:rhodanese-related sulfurtransferase